MVKDDETKSNVEPYSAETEKWKAVQRAIGLTESAGRFVNRIVGPAADALGGLLGDQMKSWRASNLDRLSRKWERIMKERGVKADAAKHLPFGEAFRTLEIASIEEDEDVQELWAELLASSMDPTRNISIKKFYIDILKSLSSVEASLLNVLWMVRQRRFLSRPNDAKIHSENISRVIENTWLKYPKQDQETAIQNLMRLRCIAPNLNVPRLDNLLQPLPPSNSRSFGMQNSYAAVNTREFHNLIVYLETLGRIAMGHAALSQQAYQRSPSELTSEENAINPFSYVLTKAGKDLLRACKAT